MLKSAFGTGKMILTLNRFFLPFLRESLIAAAEEEALESIDAAAVVRKGSDVGSTYGDGILEGKGESAAFADSTGAAASSVGPAAVERRNSDVNMTTTPSGSSTPAEPRSRRSSKLTEEEGECPICFEEVKNGLTLPCTHGPFCQACISAWNVGHKSCPVCRRSVKDTKDCWVHLDYPATGDLVPAYFLFSNTEFPIRWSHFIHSLRR